MRSRALLVLLVLAAGVAARGQNTDPDTERGMRPGLAYKLGDFDHVNLFNGTLTMNLPIGGTYPVGGTLSYSFMLSYATNTWDTDVNEVLMADGEYQDRSFQYPSANMNAGFGWLFTLGAVIDTPGGAGRVYLAPDGGQHEFFDTLHANNPAEPDNDLATQYTRDGTYLRLHQMPAGVCPCRIDFPNGHVHYFNGSGQLTDIIDPSGQSVHVAYGTWVSPYGGGASSPVWTITDSVDRQHKVYFRPNWAYDEIPSNPNNPAPAPLDRTMVDHIELASFNDPNDASDGTATYSFTYDASPSTQGGITEGMKTSRRCRAKSDPTLAPYVVTSYLTKVEMPESVIYSGMTYERGDTTKCTGVAFNNEYPVGNITSVVLPTGLGVTGGRIEWTYQRYLFPGQPVGFSANYGIKERKIYNGSTLLSQTEYQADKEYRPGSTTYYDVWRREVNKDGNGTVLSATKHYFTACRESFTVYGNPACGNGGEYGLPFSRIYVNGGSGAFLSTIVERPDGTPLRKTWLKYEGDMSLTLYYWFANNQRLIYQRTEYCDKTPYDSLCWNNPPFSDVTYSDFDGLGHYRQAVTGGNFEKGNVRTSFTNYNPGSGTFQLDGNGNVTGFNFPPEWGPWLLAEYDKQWSEEGGVTTAADFCTDPVTGAVTARRIFKNFGQSPTKTTADLLTIFTYDTTAVPNKGNLIREQYFGGEKDNNAPTGYTCNTALSGESYRVDHANQYGVRKTSNYVDGNGSFFNFDILDNDIDQNTGLVRVARRSSTRNQTDGVATTYKYDALGRLKKATSPKLRAEYTYQVQPPLITAVDYDNTTQAEIRRSTSSFDVFGRLIRETRSMPQSVTAARETKYNALGWKTEVSEWGATAFTVFTYDELGRPVRVRAPDQDDTTALQIAYNGASSVTRTAKVRTNGNAAPLTAANLSDSVSTEEYDRQGRLVRVTEPAQSVGGSRPVTEYSYDVGNRLTTVCANKAGGSCGQTRSFTYDNRGFLGSETHPENGTTTYPVYDARGHLRRRYIGTTSDPFHLGFEYDRAERLTQVHEADSSGNETRKLKFFTYGTNNSGSDLRNGRVTSAMRFNWVSVGTINYNVRVTEDYQYADSHGDVSWRKTSTWICTVSGSQDCKTTAAPVLPDKYFSEFQQTFDYDPLGATKELGYPECLHTNCVSLIPNRWVTNGFSNGFLTSVQWSGAVVPNTFNYHSSGLVKEVHHDNWVVDETTVDPAIPSRPLSLITHGAQDPGCAVPTFTDEPDSQTITSGTNVTLTAAASGESGQTVHYQWYRGTAPDRTNPVGTDSPSYSVTLTATTSYWVEAWNTCSGTNRTVSSTATITVCTPPSVTLPADRSITRTQSTTITGTTSGTSPLSYQWYTVVGATETAISGATSSSLTVSPTSSTTYRLRASNDCGASYDDIVVTVLNPPTTPAMLGAAYNAGTNTTTVNWQASTAQAGLLRYVVTRNPGNTQFNVANNLTSFPDTSGVSGAAYVYRVKAVDNNNVSSADSSPELATRVSFTDDPILDPVASPPGTLIKGLHVSQLRQAIDAVRAAADLPAAWTSYTAPTGPVYAAHFTEMRDKLNEARTTLLLPEVTLTDNVTPTQLIRRGTVTQLRDGVK